MLPGAKQVFDWGRQLVTITSATKKNAEDIADLRQEFKDLNEKVDRIARFVEKMAYQQQLDRQNAEQERKIQQLSLENALLKAGIRASLSSGQGAPQLPPSEAGSEGTQ